MILASLCGFDCPRCGNFIIASEVRGMRDPAMATTKCDQCGNEFQVTDDKKKGGLKVERAKKH